jgi:hypothetical protein
MYKSTRAKLHLLGFFNIQLGSNIDLASGRIASPKLVFQGSSRKRDASPLIRKEHESFGGTMIPRGRSYEQNHISLSRL